MRSSKLLFAGGLLGFSLLSGAVLSAPKASADTSSTVDVTVNVPAACALSATNNNLTKTINPGTFDTIGTANLKAICNDPDGFAVYAIGYTDNVHGNNYLTTELGEDYKIASGTAENGDTSNWSMTLAPIAGDYAPTIENGFHVASAIPGTNTKVASYTSNTDASIGGNFTATFKAYINPAQAAGTYQGKVKFTLVHPNANASVLQMQNVGEWGDSIEPGQTVYAVDTRDNEIYSVARLADGNLWMTQNLRLNLETANITSQNTNRPASSFLNAIESKPAANNDSSTWCNQATSDCVDQILYSTINIGDTTTDSYGHTYDEYGVYYNWYTATAGTRSYEMTSTSASGDICPKGWHLPTGGNLYSDMGTLNASLGGIFTRMNDSTNPTGASMSEILRSAPINSLYAGRIQNSTVSGRGTSSIYWSSTPYSDPSRAHVYGINDTNVLPGWGQTTKMNGGTVRCIAHEINMKETLLESGTVVNAKMKSLAAGAAKTLSDQTSDIKIIRTADSLPNDFVATEANTISVPYSQYPVYIFFDNTNNAGIMYVYSGGHQVTMNKNLLGMFASNTGLVSVEAIKDWDTSIVENMMGMFENDPSLASLDLSNWDTSNVKNTSFMFNLDSSLASLNISNWDTSNNTDMHAMFRSTALTSLDLSDWDTSNVTNMEYMFSETALTSLDLSSWDTSNVTNMNNMFSSSKALTSVNTTGWNTHNVTNMGAMFAVGDSYAGNGQLQEIIGIENWDTSNVTNMGWMFYGAGQMTHYDIANWDVSKVESFNHTFCDNFKLESLDLSRWNVQNVKSMYDMFDDNYKLTTIGDVSHWNTSSLVDLGGWLNGSSSFVGINGVLDLSGWDTSKLKSAEEVFRAVKLTTIDLTGWTFDAITNSAWDGAGSGTYAEYGTALDRMFQNMPQLQTVYVSQSGLNSYNAAVSRGVDTTNMWSGSNISGFTVK